ncbi:MAG: hypothetical protein QOD80_68 [Verrucomicrobiota bacterium]
MGQLTSVAYNADQVWTESPLNATRTVSYNLDPLNRISFTDNGTQTGYTPDALNQYVGVGGQSPTYDANFNVTGFDGASFNYNAANQLMSGSKGGNMVQFVYDGLGRCLKRTINGVTTLLVYDGWKSLAEWAGDGSWWAYRIYGAGVDEVLWLYDSRVGYARVHTDMRGNVSFLLDAGGNGVERYTYDAFGQPTIHDWYGGVRSDSAYGNRFLFQGREWIPELGIYDFRFRQYQPQLGRFLQKDPLGFGGGDANLFRFCGSDPVNRKDAYGLKDKVRKTYNKDRSDSTGGTEITLEPVIVSAPELPGYDGHRDINVLDQSAAAPGEGSARDTGGGGEGTLYAQNARPPMSNRTVPVAPLRREENELPHDEPETDWPPSPREAAASLDSYRVGLEFLLRDVHDLLNWLFGPAGTAGFQGFPAATPGPSGSPNNLPGPSPSGPPPPHG